MVLQTSSFARRPDDENTPPTARLAGAKPRVHGGIQGASRRRRARSVGGHHLRHAVERAKHKSTIKPRVPPVDIEPPHSSGEEAEASGATSTTSITRISLPRYLTRPPFCGIAKETIMSVAPELADTDLEYARQALQFLGPHMLQVLAGVKAEPELSSFPKELAITVDDLSSDMPTHMLAIHSRPVSAANKCRVTLFPIHNIILAIHCANLPTLPASSIARPDTPGSTICVPVVPLCIPAPEVFPQLCTFLYTKRVDHLLTSLMPCPVPQPLYCDDPTSEYVVSLLQQFASNLATDYIGEKLLAHAMYVNGLWRNVCSLGIDDVDLWCALDVAWEVLIVALCISTGKPVKQVPL